MGSKNRRWRPAAGHVMLELLYGKASYITRRDHIEVNISQMAQGMYMRPIKLIRSFEWLAEIGLITELDIRRYTATMRTRLIEGPPQPSEEIVTEPIPDPTADRAGAPETSVPTWIKS